tara:strand:- start:332 stop:484 length:153 start_codon:yes stop_codon:yes gene_type:complete
MTVVADLKKLKEEILKEKRIPNDGIKEEISGRRRILKEDKFYILSLSSIF